MRHGTFTTWLYAFLGLVPYTIEFWDVETAAGIEKKEFFMERGRTEEELRHAAEVGRAEPARRGLL